MLQLPGDAGASTDPLSDALARLDTQRVKTDASDTREELGGLPPRQSSDSTLHPLPGGGRPSSAPSCRSSFESCLDGCSMSDPCRSQRGSFEQGDSSAVLPAAAAAASPGRPCAAVSQAPIAEDVPPQLPLPTPTQQQRVLQQTSLLHAADEQVAGRPQPVLTVRPQAAEPQPSPFCQAQTLEPFSHLFTPSAQQQQHQQQERLSLQLGGLSPGGTHRSSRRRSTGKHPANLERGSTAPPGAIDELAELLLAAAGRANSGNGGHSSSNAPSAAASNAAAALLSAVGGRSSGSAAAALADAASGLEGCAHGATTHTTAAARGAMPRRSASAVPVGGAYASHAEPLLSSQVALLAQQLLLQQQQQSAGSPGGRNSAAQSRQQSLHLPRDRGLSSAQLEPVRNSGGRPSGFALGTAAEMLRGGNGGGGGQLHHPSPTAASTLQGLDPASQPRFASPTPMASSEIVSPFSSIQGVYGCHLLPPIDPTSPSLEASPSLTSRSSIDLLLDPVVPTTAHKHRHGLDTFPELMRSAPMTANASSPVTMVTQLLQQLGHHSTGNSNSNATGHAAVRARPVVSVRHSMDSGGAGRPMSVARTLSTLAGGHSRDRIRDLAASYYGHVSSSAMHDMANSTVTVVAGAVPVGSAAQTSRTSVSAHASSMVDPAAQPVAGTFETARVGTTEESMLDPDLHDTFGAHPSYGLPTVRPRRLSSSGGSRGPVGEAIAMLSRASGGSSSSAPSPVSMVTDGWRQPMAVPRRPPLPRSAGASPLVASPIDPRTPAVQAVAAATNGGAAASTSGTVGKPPLHHPTVYQPHKPPLSAAGSMTDFSPIGNAMMLDPTNVPGQHSITVHDPQYAIPSLPFLRQCALARKKMARQESAGASRGGYIAEAKRVLAAAVHTATAQEAAVVESSCSGAIGPLLRYLRDNKHNDSALRSGLHTLSLLVTNSPNRGIIVSFHGQAMLCEVMRATQDIDLREDCVQLLWDLEALNKECHFDPEDILALQSVLEATSNACIASHILHLLYHCLGRHDAPDMSHEQMQLCAQRLVDEIAAHKHHLQDAAQYALGNLMAVVLGDARLTPAQRLKHVSRLLDELRKTNTPGQCQVVLTVLSCIAGNARVRSSMAHCQARRRLMEFGQHIPDPRLRARSLSLIKILHKQEALEGQGGGSWYFGAAAGTGTVSEASGSPRCAEPSC